MRLLFPVSLTDNFEAIWMLSTFYYNPNCQTLVKVFLPYSIIRNVVSFLFAPFEHAAQRNLGGDADALFHRDLRRAIAQTITHFC